MEKEESSLKNRIIRHDLKDALFRSGLFIRNVMAILSVIYLLSGIYSISQNEIGIVLRFGKIINDSVMPGIHIGFPWPVERVYKVPVKSVKRVSVKDFSGEYNDMEASIKEFTKAGNDPYYYQRIPKPYCITGDNNIVNMSCGIQYSIDNPTKYFQYLNNSEEVLHEITNRVIINCFSTLSVSVVLTYGKREIEKCIKRKTQTVLDNVASGLSVTFVEIESVSPPENVKTYFNDVINASIDVKRMINDAEAYTNQKIPEATSDANRLMEDAKGYRDSVVQEAQGDAKRFTKILKEYRKAKSITRKRFYIDTMKEIARKIDKIYILSKKEGRVPAKINLIR